MRGGKKTDRRKKWDKNSWYPESCPSFWKSIKTQKITTKAPDKFKLKKWFSPVRMSVVSLSEYGKCLSLVWIFGTINSVSAKGQNWVLNLVSVSLRLWLKRCCRLSGISAETVSSVSFFPLSSSFFSLCRRCWTAQWSKAKHPMSFWRVWGRGQVTWSRWGPEPWPASEPTARICSSKHSLTVSVWADGRLECVEVCVEVELLWWRGKWVQGNLRGWAGLKNLAVK